MTIEQIVAILLLTSAVNALRMWGGDNTGAAITFIRFTSGDQLLADETVNVSNSVLAKNELSANADVLFSSRFANRP